MNKSKLATRVAAATSLPKATADRTVGILFSIFTEALASGETVTIAGLATFETRNRDPRQGRNPLTGEPIAIAASTAPSFKAGRSLRDAVKSTCR